MDKLNQELPLTQGLDSYIEESFADYEDVNENIIRNFEAELDERMEQMKVFSPYMEILRRNRNKEGEAFPIPELCMAVLTFLLYEGRLKFKGLLLREIQEFIINAVLELTSKPLSQEDGLSLTSEVLDELQNNGANFIVRYYSFEQNSHREKHVKLIEMKLSDEDGKLYYYITKEGLDFYMKTKEFPEESQITVNLLLFKMQLEKGAFQYAYDTIRRLNMEVQRKLERKEYILGLLMAGGKEGSIAYREYHQGTMLQFQEESELFQQSRSMLENTFEDFNNKLARNTITDKEKRAFQMIKRIEKEMRKAVGSHETLLKEATNLVKDYDDILEMRRRTAFTEKFNFSGEFEKLVDRDLPPQNMKYLWEPLNKPFVRKGFNPMKIFLPQRITKEDDVEDSSFEEEVEKAPVETKDQIVQARVSQNFLIYATSLLSSLFSERSSEGSIEAGQGNELDLRAWCDILSREYGSESIGNGDFVSFLIVLNRGKETGSKIKSYVLSGEMSTSMAGITEEEELRSMEDVLYIAAKRSGISLEGLQLEVESLEDNDIDIGWGIKVTNMKFRGGRLE
ncbi:MAG: hypothetical protein GX783_06680 [Clostridiales bacterium]|nr:hypothetical protein [Clostridiales bacterium]